MIINFIANYGNGYIGEISDSVHLAREMEDLGHKVQRVPQDIWKAYCDGEQIQKDWVLPLANADINIITKWHHFNDKKYIDLLHAGTQSPVFYFVWDYMQQEDWHMTMVKWADLYLGNDVYSPAYKDHENAYYFPFDVADGNLPIFQFSENKKKYDVVFFGSYERQGDRIQWLKEINRIHKVKIFAFNHTEWEKEGFDASPPVWGVEFNKAVAESKIVLGFSVEPHAYGYWSNRVGKVLLAGGFLLYQYAPGMELRVSDGMEYFSTIEEANQKIDFYLNNPELRQQIESKGKKIGRERFSSKARIKDLMILCERYLIEKGDKWQI